ncbi:hypothetical protein ACHAWF_015013 [Thalassiosira exigua]
MMHERCPQTPPSVYRFAAELSPPPPPSPTRSMLPAQDEMDGNPPFLRMSEVDQRIRPMNTALTLKPRRGTFDEDRRGGYVPKSPTFQPPSSIVWAPLSIESPSCRCARAEVIAKPTPRRGDENLAKHILAKLDLP